MVLGELHNSDNKMVETETSLTGRILDSMLCKFFSFQRDYLLLNIVSTWSHTSHC